MCWQSALASPAMARSTKSSLLIPIGKARMSSFCGQSDRPWRVFFPICSEAQFFHVWPAHAPLIKRWSCNSVECNLQQSEMAPQTSATLTHQHLSPNSNPPVSFSQARNSVLPSSLITDNFHLCFFSVYVWLFVSCLSVHVFTYAFTIALTPLRPSGRTLAFKDADG